MKWTGVFTIMFFAFIFLTVLANAGEKDIPLNEVPKDVITVLNKYLK